MCKFIGFLREGSTNKDIHARSDGDTLHWTQTTDTKQLLGVANWEKSHIKLCYATVIRQSKTIEADGAFRSFLKYNKRIPNDMK